jgi:ElaB/YqjD/DUF883 family membrane-anchored ribosome-binding protein
MAKLTYTERLGFARELLEFIKANTEKLKSVGLNAQDIYKKLDEKINANVKENQIQESLKAQLSDQTDKVNAVDKEMYVSASSYLDMIVGALRKDSESAKVLGRLRSKARLGKRVEKKP